MDALTASAGDRVGWRFDNTLLRVSGADFLARPAALQTEAFGPLSLVVLASGEAGEPALIRFKPRYSNMSVELSKHY